MDQSDNNRFEAIVAAGLLEFAIDPVAVLRSLRAILPDQGCLAALIPNVAHVSLRLALLGGRFPYGDWDQPEHIPLRFYTRETIEALFASAGLEIRDIKRREARINFHEETSEPLTLPADLIEDLKRDPEALTSHFFILAGPTIQNGVEHGQHDCGAPGCNQITLLQRMVEEQDGRLEALAARVEFTEGELQARRSAPPIWTAPPIDASVVANLRAVQNALANLSVAQSSIGWSDRNGDPCHKMEYQRIIHRIRGIVRATLPPDTTVLAISRGDDALLKLDGRTGWHFPMTDGGAYAGHHPADSAEAISHLEELRARGGKFLLIPSTAFWWLVHYPDFARHLECRYRVVARREDSCVIFALEEA